MERRMLLSRFLTPLALALAPLAVAPALLHGQFEVESRVGLAWPVGDLRSYVDPGMHYGLGAAWWRSERLGFRAQADLADLSGSYHDPSRRDLPDMNLLHAGVGVFFDPLGGGARQRGAFVKADLGLGVSVVDTQPFMEDATNGHVRVGQGTGITKAFPSLSAGFEVGQELGDRTRLGVGVRGIYAFLNDDGELARLSAFRPGKGFDNGISVPVSVTVQIDV